MINFSELLWKSGRPREKGLRSRLSVDSEALEIPSILRDIPVETVECAAQGRAGLLMDPRSAAADRFRYLRMRLRELREIAKLQSLVVTSPVPEDGKSTIATCLATALAEGGKRNVLLIEADLHHPTLASSLGIRARHGLAECVESELDPMSEVRKLEPLGWHLLQAGRPSGNPTELLQSDAIAALIQRVSAHFDWVLVDSPPALPLTDAVSLSRQADATLLVVRADRTSREAVEETIKLIGLKHVVGIVLNGAANLDRLYSEYGGYYTKK